MDKRKRGGVVNLLCKCKKKEKKSILGDSNLINIYIYIYIKLIDTLNRIDLENIFRIFYKKNLFFDNFLYFL